MVLSGDDVRPDEHERPERIHCCPVRRHSQAVGALEEFDRAHSVIRVLGARDDLNVCGRDKLPPVLRADDPHVRRRIRDQPAFSDVHHRVAREAQHIGQRPGDRPAGVVPRQNGWHESHLHRFVRFYCRIHVRNRSNGNVGRGDTGGNCHVTGQSFVIDTGLGRAADTIKHVQFSVRRSGPADGKRAGVRPDFRCIRIAGNNRDDRRRRSRNMNRDRVRHSGRSNIVRGLGREFVVARWGVRPC